MDEMKVKLSTNFMKGIVTKIIRKAIRKKYGYNVDILLNTLEVKTMEGGKIGIHLDVDAELTNDEFMKIISKSMF